MRASITSGPSQPQCFCRMHAPTPCTSAAGFDRVNVTHSQLLSVRAVKSLSSTSTTNGKTAGSSPGRNASQNRRTSAGASPSPPRPPPASGEGRRRLHRQHARQAHARIAESFRQNLAVRQPRRQLPTHRSRRRDHHLRAFVQPRAAVVQRVDRGAQSGNAGLFANPRAPAGAERTPECRERPGQGRLLWRQ